MRVGDLKGRIAAVCVIIVCLGGSGQAQFSSYVSATYGYQSNPLYDYRQISDPVQSAYMELAYAAENFSVKYAGGLTLFNQLTDRNYLDHSVLFALSFPPPVSEVADTSGSGEDAVEGEEAAPSPDSLGASGGISLRVTGRHDKVPYRQFDNASGGITGSVRWGFDGWNLRLSADAGVRKYPLTNELSNASGVVAARLTSGTGEGWSAGVGAQAGVKRFLAAAFDSGGTTHAITYDTVLVPGSGMTGAIVAVPTASAAATIVNPDVRTTGQVAGSFTVGYGWKAGSLSTELLYRYNVTTATRILSRTADTSPINEDLYNDFFSYGGLESRLTLRQKLPASVQVTVAVNHLRKRFGAPAYDLLGAQIAGTRMDNRTEVEFYVSRYFPLSEDLGMDLAISGGAVRNESNDRYNDFSGWMMGFSVGVGF